MPVLSPSSSPTSYLERTKSFVIAENITQGKARVNFSSRRLIKCGGQGEIYAVKVDFLEPSSGQATETKLCVLKKIVSPLGVKQGSLFGVHAEITKEDETTLDHNILKLICILVHEGQDYALLPFCEAFLNKQIPVLHSTDTQAIEPLLKMTLIVHIITNLLNALSYMHSRGFVHRDIKPDNIAFHLGRWCLIDLDISTGIRTESVGHGPGYYIHPAGVRMSGFLTDPLNDIYALGIVLRLMLDPTYHSDLLKTPPATHLYRLTLAYDTMKKESGSAIKPLTSTVCLAPTLLSIENDLKELASRMTSLDEQQIPSVATLLSIFNELNNCLLKIDSSLNRKLSDYYLKMVAASQYRAFSPRMFPSVPERELNTSQIDSTQKQVASP